MSALVVVMGENGPHNALPYELTASCYSYVANAQNKQPDGHVTNLDDDPDPEDPAVDPDGNSYIAGETRSPDLPIVNGFDAVCGGDGQCENPFTDAFMMKLNPNGAILYSTYLGGSGIGGETAHGIAVDPQRRAIVVGFTTSSDFPTLNPLFPLLKGPEDGFVTKIELSGRTRHRQRHRHRGRGARRHPPGRHGGLGRITRIGRGLPDDPRSVEHDAAGD